MLHPDTFYVPYTHISRNVLSAAGVRVLYALCLLTSHTILVFLEYVLHCENNLRFVLQVFLAAGAFTVTEKRKALVNFTVPISIQTTTLLSARPGEMSRALIFMAPFTYDVSSTGLAQSSSLSGLKRQSYKIPVAKN